MVCQLAGNGCRRHRSGRRHQTSSTWDLGDAKLTGRIDGKYVSKQFFGA
jgi:hypothetical protein